MNEWSLFGLIFVGIFAIIITANWFQLKLKIKSESIRIFVHILVGTVVSTLYLYI